MLKRRGAHFRPVPERRCRSRLTLEAAGGQALSAHDPSVATILWDTLCATTQFLVATAGRLLSRAAVEGAMGKGHACE